MKIKRKVEMNLPQLIEWGFENDMRNKNFESEGGAMVCFDYDGNLTCARGFVPQDFFTVTTEEELTEDTEIELLLEVRNGGTVIPYYNESIKSQVDKIVKEYHAYIDGEFKLIWTHEKGLVE